MCTMHADALGAAPGGLPARASTTACSRGRAAPDGDDLTAADEWVGDRDPRSEDRQLLLDAVMAAEDRLVVIYAGADPRTGAGRPPAVPIGELLDALDRTARHRTGGRSVST